MATDPLAESQTSVVGGRIHAGSAQGEDPQAARRDPNLGYPTVLDRLIQQALHQVLQPLFEPEFSESSYGFRPGRNAHQAVQAARRYVAEGSAGW